jgi:hypothetical protein
MHAVKIVRLEESSEGALGALLLYGRYFCSTLEPDDKDPERFQIPAGVYECKRFHGAKWKDTFEIIVPGHYAVLFHAGNVEKESLGCVLLGQYPGKLNNQRAILNSGATFKQFMAILGELEDFILEIIECY